MMENAPLVGSGASAKLLLGRKLDSIPFSIYHVQIILVLGVVGFVEGYDLALSGSLLVLAKEPLHLTPEQIRWLVVAPLLFVVVGAFTAAVVIGGASLFGGSGTLIGPILGTAAVEGLSYALADVDAIKQVWPVILGVVLLVVVMFQAKGILGLVVRTRDQWLINGPVSYLARRNAWMWQFDEPIRYLLGLLMLAVCLALVRALLLFGTEDQRQQWLPAMASGAKLGAFALTEPEAGSDAANVQTSARPSADGSHYVLNGQKRYITNGALADVLTVMARTPVPGRETTAVTAFRRSPRRSSPTTPRFRSWPSPWALLSASPRRFW